MAVLALLASCEESPAPAPKLAKAPQTLADLEELAGRGNASSVHEFDHNSAGGYTTCDNISRSVTVKSGSSPQQLAGDLLAYFFQLPGNPCKSRMLAFYAGTEHDVLCQGFGCKGDFYTAGRVELAVRNGQQTLSLVLGRFDNASEYLVTYTCGPGVCFPGPLPRGTYTTHNFLPGMTISVPTDGMSSCQDSSASFQLQPFTSHPYDASVFFWVNPHAVDTDGVRVPGVPGTPEGLIGWFKRNPDLIVSAPTTRTIAGGIEASIVDVEVVKSTPLVSTDDDQACPGRAPARAASGLHVPLQYLEFGGVFGDTTPSPGYGVGYGSSPGQKVRLYFAKIGTTESTANTLVISIDAFHASDFPPLATTAETILNSLRLLAALPPSPR
jgi:hypothetical protein